MPSQPPLPPLLTSYLSDQRESSLTLVSSILGATSNWLVLRYLYAALGTSSSSNISIGTDELSNGAKRKVVLVSFLRGWEFWRAEAKRLVSSDFPKWMFLRSSYLKLYQRLYTSYSYYTDSSPGSGSCTSSRQATVHLRGRLIRAIQ